MDEIARMDVLQATEQLPSQEQDGFDRELKMTANKEILKGWAKILNHHCIKAGFYAKPTHAGDPSPSAKPRIDMILVIQSVIFSFHRLEFNDDIFLQQNIMRKIYFMGGPRRQSSFQPISPGYANEFHVHPM
jgi:hypothetical protein